MMTRSENIDWKAVAEYLADKLGRNLNCSDCVDCSPHNCDQTDEACAAHVLRKAVKVVMDIQAARKE